MKNKNILFKNFKLDKKNINTKKILTELLKEDNKILQSLSNNYSNSYTKKSLSKYKNFKNIRIIGMGGSSLGTRAIYSFCLLYTSPSPRDVEESRMPSSA